MSFLRNGNSLQFVLVPPNGGRERERSGGEEKGKSERENKMFFFLPSLGSSRHRRRATSSTVLLDQQPRLLPFRRQLHVGRQAHQLQGADHHPRHVELELLEAVPSRELECVVVVVPAFTKGEDADPPVVAREVAGVVGLRAPDVADAVDEPGDLLLM